MTMNIMSVSVASSSEQGGLASGKAAGAAKGGVFADVFSQQSESQSSSGSFSPTKSSFEQIVEGKTAQDPAIQHTPANNASAVAQDDTEQHAASDAAAATTVSPKTSQTTTAEAANASIDEDEVAPTLAALAQPQFATLNLAAEPNPAAVEATPASASTASRTSEQVSLNSQFDAGPEAELSDAVSPRQGGSSLPPESAAAQGSTHSAAGSALALSEPQLPKTAVQHLDKDEAAKAAESLVKNSAANQASLLNHAALVNQGSLLTQTSQLNQNNLANNASATNATVTNGAGLSQAPIDGEPSANAGTSAANTTAAAFLSASSQAVSSSSLAPATPITTTPITTTTATAAQQAAQILAQQAELTVQEQVSEQDAKAELGNRVANLAPDTAARSAAPEWLAQIEHGKRWSQTSGGAGNSTGESAADSAGKTSATKTNLEIAEPSLALGEKTAAARAINAALSKAGSADTGTVNSLAANGLSQGLPEQAKPAESTGLEASGLLVNREQTLLAATPERTAMLDKALTLHGSAEQNAKQLAQQAQVVVSQNLQEAEIKLNPSEFGAMRIQIRMEQGEVQVQFVASHPQARELLEQAMPRLREMLQQQGMNLQQGGQQSGQQPSGQQQSGQQSAQSSGLSQQGVSQSGAEQGQSGQQQASHSGQEAANTEWRSYSAAGDELQERGRDLSAGASYGKEGAKIDFFA